MTEKKKTRKYCQNCGKPIETGLFCRDECGKIYYREPVGAKPLDKCQTQPQNEDDAPNRGTEAKRLLQEQAIKCMQKYPKNLTKKQ